MTSDEMKNRFKLFALAIVHFAEQLPEKPVGYRTVRNQIVRCGPSAAANYRAACRGRSSADFVAKLGIVEEELDETQFWLEFTVGLSEEWRAVIAPLWREADELLSIVVSSIKTSRKNRTENRKKKKE